MLKEINGRFTCDLCGYELSAMLGDDEIPEHCPACYEYEKHAFVFFDADLGLWGWRSEFREIVARGFKTREAAQEDALKHGISVINWTPERKRPDDFHSRQ